MLGEVLKSDGPRRKGARDKIDKKQDWPLFAAVGAGLVGMVSLFLPGVVAPGEESAVAIKEIDGMIAFSLLALVVFLGVVALFIPEKWAGTTTGALAMIAGSYSALVWLLSHPGPYRPAHSGIGLILLLIAGLALVCLGIWILFFRQERQ